MSSSGDNQPIPIQDEVSSTSGLPNSSLSQPPRNGAPPHHDTYDRERDRSHIRDRDRDRDRDRGRGDWDRSSKPRDNDREYDRGAAPLPSSSSSSSLRDVDRTRDRERDRDRDRDRNRDGYRTRDRDYDRDRDYGRDRDYDRDYDRDRDRDRYRDRDRDRYRDRDRDRDRVRSDRVERSSGDRSTDQPPPERNVERTYDRHHQDPNLERDRDRDRDRARDRNRIRDADRDYVSGRRSTDVQPTSRGSYDREPYSSRRTETSYESERDGPIRKTSTYVSSPTSVYTSGSPIPRERSTYPSQAPTRKLSQSTSTGNYVSSSKHDGDHDTTRERQWTNSGTSVAVPSHRHSTGTDASTTSKPSTPTNETSTSAVVSSVRDNGTKSTPVRKEIPPVLKGPDLPLDWSSLPNELKLIWDDDHLFNTDNHKSNLKELKRLHNEEKGIRQEQTRVEFSVEIIQQEIAKWEHLRDVVKIRMVEEEKIRLDKDITGDKSNHSDDPTKMVVDHK